MFPTFPCHFLWKRAKSMVFGGKLEQALTLLVSLCPDWVFRKKASKVPPLMPEVFSGKNAIFSGKVAKTSFVAIFDFFVIRERAL